MRVSDHPPNDNERNRPRRIDDRNNPKNKNSRQPQLRDWSLCPLSISFRTNGDKDFDAY